MNPTNNSQPKKHKGRRKVNMEKMENESNLQVTFSKRRVGLFKKASELCTLTGSKAAVVVFSPGGKAHSFGHPDVNTIADQYLNPNSQSGNNNIQQSSVPIEGQEYLAQHGQFLTLNSRPAGNHAAGQSNHVQQSSTLTKDQQYLALVESQIRAEKARGEEMDRIRKASLDKLNYQQLEHLRGAIMEFSKKLEIQVEKGVNSTMGCDVVRGTYPGQDFGASSSSHGNVVPYATVIPYDQGATSADAEEFNNGYGRRNF
ncbi:hypothetical protein ACP275_02G081100 [Erythranthe tilingii]